jgi:hypothetical protein
LVRLPGGRLVDNDHTDPRADDRTLAALASVGARLGRQLATASACLARFDGYQGRYAAALDRARSGQRTWVDGIGVPSCHRVWIELHEDLIATLGLHRGGEPPPSAAASG